MTRRSCLTAFAVFTLCTTSYAQTVKIDLASATLDVKVADTPTLQEKGLQGVKKLDPNHGMLFVFEKPSRVCFWMKNTPLELDIGFFNETQQLIDVQTMTPNTQTLHCAPEAISYALEVNRGWFSKNRIIKGTRFVHVPNK